MTKQRVTAALAALWLLTPIFLAAGAEPEDKPAVWLERMSAAMTHLTYQGTFVYIQGNESETMRITHVAGNEGVQERLVALSGPRREVIRDADGVRWMLSESSSILADTSFQKPIFPNLPADLESQAGESYELKFGKATRIAGHRARNVLVLPRDHYRYGHSLWLEEHSSLPLQWELFDSKRKTLAKYVFTEMLMGSEVDLHELERDSEATGYQTVSSSLPAGETRNSGETRWSPRQLPPGFTLSKRRSSVSPDSPGMLFEHLVYSDGLAAVSVYVENSTAGGRRSEGVQQHGTTHAYRCYSGDVSVTVVGNVPAATVELIGRSVVAASP